MVNIDSYMETPSNKTKFPVIDEKIKILNSRVSNVMKQLFIDQFSYKKGQNCDLKKNSSSFSTYSANHISDKAHQS